METNSRATLPFLKWAGGKRWLTPTLKEILKADFNQYFEPFLGGGATFFAINPKASVLSDLNRELIDLFKVVRDQPLELAAALRLHQKKHCRDYYYHVRSQRPRLLLNKAARTLYLNRTCFNGLYRVNLSGNFNVPMGTKKNVIWDNEDFSIHSHMLNSAEIFCQDFSETIKLAGKRDFIYVDPPYTVAHNVNGFLKYNDQIFSWDDQLRLREELESAALRGAKIIVSNANHESIKQLYRDFGRAEEVPRHSIIAASKDKRIQTSELIFRVGI